MKFSALLVAVLSMASSTSAFPSMAKRGGGDEPKVGEYRPAGSGDLRSPCPALNALANHGYFPRDGRNIDFDTFVNVILERLGLAKDFTAILAGAALKVNTRDPPRSDHPVLDWLGIGRSIFGVRESEDQVDPVSGKPVINLGDLNRHGAIEHDVSLTRKDAAQGDNHSPDPALVSQFIAASSDGEFLTRDDLAAYRRLRYQQQKDWYRRNGKEDELNYGLREEGLAFGEAALIEGIFGYQYATEEYKVPVSYIKALFAEERLPSKEEGWTPRKPGMGIIEGNLLVAAIKLKAGWNS